jgi:hypothetical protein
VQRVAMRFHEPPERFLVTAQGRLEFHPAMSFPAAGGSDRYGTNHCHRTHLIRRRRRAPGPGDIGDHPHKGWVTYETMAAFWPGFDGPFADKLNAMTKYVLSTTLERVDWADSTILRGDLVTEVTRLA